MSGFSIREAIIPFIHFKKSIKKAGWAVAFCFSQRRQQTSLALSYRKIHERNARAAANSPEPLHVSISHNKYFLPISRGNAGMEFLFQMVRSLLTTRDSRTGFWKSICYGKGRILPQCPRDGKLDSPHQILSKPPSILLTRFSVLEILMTSYFYSVTILLLGGITALERGNKKIEQWFEVSIGERDC